MDGWRLASEINNNKKINNAKLFLLTPEGNIDKDAKMKLLGWFNGYLYKPIKIQNHYELLNENENEIVDLEVIEAYKSFVKGIGTITTENYTVNSGEIHTIYKYQKISIVTAHKDIMREALVKHFAHGVTIYEAEGGYTATPRWVFESIVLTYEIEEYRKIYKETQINKNYMLSNIIQSIKPQR